MERLVIQGGHRLEGTVQICGAKNAALPQLAATLLSDEPVTLTNVPELADIRSMLTLMEHYGVAVRGPAHATVTLDASGAKNSKRPMTWCGGCGRTVLVWRRCWRGSDMPGVSQPGGCAIGARRWTCTSRPCRRSARRCRSTAGPSTRVLPTAG